MLVGEIATASGEQAQGIVQVLEAVTKIDRVTQGNAASAEEAAAAAEELNAQAFALKNLVDELNKLVGTKTPSSGATDTNPATTLKVPKHDAGAVKITPAKKAVVKADKAAKSDKADSQGSSNSGPSAPLSASSASRDFEDFSAPSASPMKKVTSAKAAAQNAQNYDDFFKS